MSERDFLSLLEGHVGGLVRLCPLAAASGLRHRLALTTQSGRTVDGRVGLLLKAKNWGGSRVHFAVELFVDGEIVRLEGLRQREIELIGADGV